MIAQISFGQSLADQPVVLSYQQQSLAEILEDLADKYELSFSYAKMDLALAQTINYSGSLDAGLQQLFKPLGIEHRWIGSQVVLKYGFAIGRAVKGQVLDEQTKVSLIGATIWVLDSDPVIGASSDEDGYFKIAGLPIGRYDFQVQYLGYEPRVINQVLVNAGKETFLEIPLSESTMSLGEVVVEVERDPGAAVNEMAGPTARAFSAEQTQRYAAAISDPARMVQSYAGVSNGGDDLSNEIVVRGNSSRGLLWKIDGIEVTNPNHFSGLGAGGGSVSMLSSRTMADSDFYTGAFPAEFGNALTGVFDMRLRNGNKDKREHSIVIGNLGMEAATEGYISRKSRASYLANYRYSTIELIAKYLPSIERQKPAYRDLHLKLNVPTDRFGLFKVFTLHGNNKVSIDAIRNPETWQSINDATDTEEAQRLGVIGASHRYLFADDSYLTSAVSVSSYRFRDRTVLLELQPDMSFLEDTVDESSFANDDYALAINYFKKFHAGMFLSAGITMTHKRFDYRYFSIDPDFMPQQFIKGAGNTNFLQAYLQGQIKPYQRMTLIAGLHFSQLFLNNTFGIDPRLALTYDLTERQTVSLSAGLHSKPEHASTYFIERIEEGADLKYPNLDLPMSRAVHLVAGYSAFLRPKLRFKTELYYQYLYNVPVSADTSSGFSVLNSLDVFDIVFGNRRSTVNLAGEGRGRNYGIELSLERFLGDGYYYMVNSSLFDSQYSGINKQWHRTRVATNFLFNALAGKEWLFGPRKQFVFALNSKFAFYGGVRDHPIHLPSSIEAGVQISIPGRFYTTQLPAYIRFDQGVSLKVNTRKTTHTFALDLQNVFNRYNIYNRYYDPIAERILDERQNGLIPFVLYRFEFSH